MLSTFNQDLFDEISLDALVMEWLNYDSSNDGNNKLVSSEEDDQNGSISSDADRDISGSEFGSPQSNIKQELRRKIKCRLYSEGKQLPDLNSEDTSQNTPVSKETHQLILERRKRNCAAAQKCRQRKKEELYTLRKKMKNNKTILTYLNNQLDLHTRINAQLTNKIRELKKENDSLRKSNCETSYLQLLQS